MKKIIAFFIALWCSLSSFAQESLSTDEKIDAIVAPAAEWLSNIIFFSIPIAGRSVPIVIIVLLGGALFFTLYNKFANIRYIGVAINAAKGKYDAIDTGNLNNGAEKEPVVGEVTHFQALTAALSATVGLGNIAGVAVAIALGGPGATVWMVLAGFLGMSSKLVEATLGVKYREVGENGKIYGGPMYYLKKGLAEKNLSLLGKILAGFFAIMIVGSSFGAGNMFQANQAASQASQLLHVDSKFGIGIVLALLVGVVIIGGIKRIGKVTEKIVPFMGLLYVGAGLVILLMNISLLPKAMGIILTAAFTSNAALGGFVGVMITGFQRAVFSNEAGAGSAAIAHSAVKTRFPASEGIVASIGPLVDTVIICTMSALVIIVMNLKENLFNYGAVDGSSVILNSTGESIGGVELTSLVFENAIPNFSYALTIAVILFAFSTMLSWSYYGLQGFNYLFGKGKVADIVYKVLFLIFIVIGASSSLDSVISFSDAMFFAIVFPNMIGLLILAPKVKKEITRYIEAIKA